MRASLPDAPGVPARAYRRRIEPIGLNWGATTEERAMPFPCDPHLPDADDACFRAVTVDAPAAITFRWLCQLKLAPYSYDWIDNLGRRSPRDLVPGVERLTLGEPVMIFRLVEFETDRNLTLLLRDSRLFGDVAITYLVTPVEPDRSRLVAKLLIRYPGPALLRPVVSRVILLGDLVMMRRQLLNFKALAEADATGTRATW